MKQKKLYLKKVKVVSLDLVRGGAMPGSTDHTGVGCCKTPDPTSNINICEK